MQGWVQPLAKTRRVIAVEMQGHGRTADTDRPMSFTTLGDDIAVLLDHLEIPKADLVGHSAGTVLIARVLSGRSATLPENLFLKASTEGLPMIRPGAVDICRPMMVRYSVMYEVTR
jgi:surfactin synthase thioesterase subunit